MPNPGFPETKEEFRSAYFAVLERAQEAEHATFEAVKILRAVTLSDSCIICKDVDGANWFDARRRLVQRVTLRAALTEKES